VKIDALVRSNYEIKVNVTQKKNKTTIFVFVKLVKVNDRLYSTYLLIIMITLLVSNNFFSYQGFTKQQTREQEANR